MNVPNEAVRLKREVLVRVAKAFMDGKLLEEVDRVPIAMRPKGTEPSRCCVYRDRAVLKYRVMSALGCGAEEEEDEALPLRHYAEKALKRERPEKSVLSVLSVACEVCVRCKYMVTNACRGCLARPCRMNCPRDAISMKDGFACIDDAKCVNCGKCMQVCPYHAIIKVPVPCEDACPFGAIRRSDDGVQFIDFEKCTSCGKCMGACPFGAVVERSQIVDVMKALKPGARVVPMVAPAIIGQFPGTLGQIAEALEKLGFDRMEEVAFGAETTARNESAEFVERIKRGDHIMTSSCCPAYVEAVKRHVTELLPFVSHTLSPMKYTAEAVKRERPDAKAVFIGPCVAKRVEAQSDPNIDFVMTFEELGAMFVAAEIDVAAMKGLELPRSVDGYARGFATSCGVTAAILNEKSKASSCESCPIPEIKSNFINGIDAKALNQLKLYAKGKLPGNFLEVMACEGGCVGGPAAIGQARLAAKAVEELAKKSRQPG